MRLDANERPGITNGDDLATFNRLRSIPFEPAIPEEKIGQDLATS